MTPTTLPYSEITNERIDVRKIEKDVMTLKLKIEKISNRVQRVEVNEGVMKSYVFVAILLVVMLMFVILVK